MAEVGQKRLLVLANLNLHYGRLGLLAWDDMSLAAEGQLDYHSMAGAEDAQLRSECRPANFFGRRPDAPVWIARPGQSVYFLVPDRKMASGEDITEAGCFVRPYAESRGWVIRSLRTRKLVATLNVHVVKDANTRHAQLTLSDDLVARHGSLDTAPDDYRDAVRKLFASHLDLPASSALVIEDPLSGMPVALVPALGADHEHVLVPESAWFADGPGPLPVLADIVRCSVRGDVRGNASLPRAFAPAQYACTVCVLPAGNLSPCLPDDV